MLTREQRKNGEASYRIVELIAATASTLDAAAQLSASSDVGA